MGEAIVGPGEEVVEEEGAEKDDTTPWLSSGVERCTSPCSQGMAGGREGRVEAGPTARNVYSRWDP